ncbi:MAG: hypothetical protein QNJ63_14225 [Calothrix sp. MO_192.B10]|nr:hypothetical protein [Calothrix sp. MO_192.B10]
MSNSYEEKLVAAAKENAQKEYGCQEEDIQLIEARYEPEPNEWFVTLRVLEKTREWLVYDYEGQIYCDLIEN